jgi:hypothetical protein
MSKKYFDTKTGSLEEKITKIATEQSSITKPESNVKLTVEKSYFGVKPGSISDVAAKIVSEGLDPVNKDAVKKKFDNRKDKDIDNDGDVDSSDKYLHKRRAAISKATSEAVMPDDKGEKINQMKHQKAKEGEKEIVKLKEDDMAKFHQMQKDGKSAEDIAKALGLNLNSVKKLMDLDEVRNPYAVGMAQAMKAKNDEPPLKKSTITKAHDIAKSIMKKEQADKVCPKCGKVHIQSSNCGGMRETKSFSQLRTETKVIKLGDKGKTVTGKDAAAVDVEPSTKPI